MYLNWKKNRKRKSTLREEKFLLAACVWKSASASAHIKGSWLLNTFGYGERASTVQHNGMGTGQSQPRNQHTERERAARRAIICIEPNDRHFKVFFLFFHSLAYLSSIWTIPRDVRPKRTERKDSVEKNVFNLFYMTPKKNLIYDITLGKGIFHLETREILLSMPFSVVLFSPDVVNVAVVRNWFGSIAPTFQRLETQMVGKDSRQMLISSRLERLVKLLDNEKRAKTEYT